MNRERIQDWLQIAGMTGVIASLVFVGLELKQSRDIAVAQVYQDRAALDVQIRSYLAPSEAVHQALGKANRKEVISQQEAEILHRALGNLFIYWETNHLLKEMGLLDQEHWNASLRAMKHTSHIPGFRQAWENEKSSFRESFQDVVDQQFRAIAE